MKKVISKTLLAGELMQTIKELCEQNLLSCYQCGKCSAGCPSSEAMDVLPSQVMRLIQLGQVEKALETKTIWLCAACHTCQVRCPRGVDMARFMEALRQVILRENVHYTHPGDIDEDDLDSLPQIAIIANLRKHTP